MKCSPGYNLDIIYIYDLRLLLVMMQYFFNYWGTEHCWKKHKKIFTFIITYRYYYCTTRSRTRAYRGTDPDTKKAVFILKCSPGYNLDIIYINDLRLLLVTMQYFFNCWGMEHCVKNIKRYSHLSLLVDIAIVQLGPGPGHTGVPTQKARFMWPTWGPPGFCRPQVGPMLVPWTLLSGDTTKLYERMKIFSTDTLHAGKNTKGMADV